MLKKLLFIACATFSLASCNDKDDNGGNSNLPDGYKYAETNELISEGQIMDNIHFFGVSTVKTISSGAIYTDDKAHFELTPASGAGASILYLHATRFAAAMPAIQMRFTDLKFAGENKTISAAATQFAPENLVAATNTWTSNSRYMITDFSAKIVGTSCEVTFTCAGIYSVTYRAMQIIKK